MTVTLTLPEKTRSVAAKLRQEQVSVTEKLECVLGTALDFLGLDPALEHQINFDTGVVTPAEPKDTAPPNAEVLN